MEKKPVNLHVFCRALVLGLAFLSLVIVTRRTLTKKLTQCRKYISLKKEKNISFIVSNYWRFIVVNSIGTGV